MTESWVRVVGHTTSLSRYVRLNRRRPPGPSHEASPPRPDAFDTFPDTELHLRPFFLRPRGRAIVVVILLGVPLLVAYVSARVLPDALWFDELGQQEVYARIVEAKVEFNLLLVGTVALFIGANLAVASRGTDMARTRVGVVTLTAASLVTGSMFASSMGGGWQTFLLWRHREAFGVDDPIYGKDVGYFVFSFPFELMVCGLLLWLVAIAAGYVVLVNRARGTLGFWPLGATFGAQVHLACLTAIFLLLVAWRLRLEQYRLELGQPTAEGGYSFSGADYVDVHARSPGLLALSILTVALALACAAAPFVARTGSRRRVVWFIGVPSALLGVSAALVGAVIPALVERYVVAPNPLLSQQPFLERSLEATSSGLGLDAIEVQPYSSTGEFSAADFSSLSDRLKNVPAWDGWVLGSRMRELVTETPYYRPDHLSFDVTRIDGRRQPTLVSPRELDLRSVPEDGGKWINDRVAFTHGLGLVRFSGMETDQEGEPRLLDAGLGVRQPRIYFGNLPQVDPDPEPGVATPTTDVAIAESPWALVGTRRPEVDIPAPDSAPRASYHYRGSGGIELSSWTRRAVFALALGSKELLLSDDITPESRILLHRDVSDRLHSLAPFIQWDAEEVPLTANGRIVFVVDGYTTSQYYPYAERVDLGNAHVNYARASVRATVDAYSGRVELYVTDESEPIARAWARIFPSLFRPVEDMPAELRQRLRYPADLFDAQATAYERFHTTRPDLFVSHADEWSRPTALSGPVEVAGDVDFDESDEDDLRRILPPSYKLAPPPGHTGLRIVLETFYTPRSGQNLVGDLAGWVDHQGRTRLAARNLQRDPVTLGPAQVSRIVFATSRVRNLLGLRNLEIRDLDKSSLDAVLLGNPRVFLLSGGVVQLQSLYEGSRGPGAARMLGVTAFLNGRAGLGKDIDSALRQALNEPPRVDMLRPEGPVVVGKPIDLPFRVENGRRAVVTILSQAGRQSRSIELASGRRALRWVPSVAGATRVRVEVAGLDGTSTTDSTAFRVLSPRPTIRVVKAPSHAVVDRPVRVLFKLTHARRGWAKVYTRGGTLVTRRYLVQGHTGVVRWTPRSAGSASLVIGARGRQGQMATRTVRLTVRPAPEVSTTPTVDLLRVPDVARVGRPSEVRFRAEECRVAIARIEGPEDDVHTWRFRCPADTASFDWTPKRPGRYLLTTMALGRDMQTQTATWLSAERL